MNQLRLEADESASKVEELQAKLKTLEQENLAKEQEITSLSHKNGLLESEVEKLDTSVKDLKKAADEGRVAKAADASGYPARLELLVQGVPDLRSPKQAKIYFMRRLPRDPFTPERELDDAATWGKRSYASEPDQPQEGDDVYDVVSRSTRVGLNGIPYNKW